MRLSSNILIFLIAQFSLTQEVINRDFLVGNWVIVEYDSRLCIDLEPGKEIVGAASKILPNYDFDFRLFKQTESDTTFMQFQWTIKVDTLIIRSKENEYMASGFKQNEHLVLVTDKNFFTFKLKKE